MPPTHAIQEQSRQRRPKVVSIVLPVFNEGAVLRQLTCSILDVADTCDAEFEIVFVNDGSSDDSPQILDALAADFPVVRVIHFSRNFGHQSALQAGLSAARGDAVIVMDSDMQDDPTAIRDFLDKWNEGYEVVYAIRHSRKEGIIKRTLFYAFYRLLQTVSATPIPVDAGNFGLIDRRVANHIVHLPELSRFYPGLRNWVGFRQIGIPVERGERYDDKARVSFWGLIRLAKTAVFSFSTAPLALFYAVALISFCVCTGLTVFTLYHKLWTGMATAGWTSGLITASFFGTLNAFGIAVLGEYVVRIFDQVRARPQFIIDRTVNVYGPKNAAASTAADVPQVNEADVAEIVGTQNI